MTVHYWLYTDPNDSKSNSIIGVVKTQFPQLVYCSNFDQLQYNILSDNGYNCYNNLTQIEDESYDFIFSSK